MKKKVCRLREAAPESLRLFYYSLSIVFLLLVSGCMTPYAIDLADKKSSPNISYSYWSITKVLSAAETENGDIFECVELHECSKSKKYEFYAISIPSSSKFINSKGLVHVAKTTEDPVKYPPGAYTKYYLFPLEKRKKAAIKGKDKNFMLSQIFPW